MDKIFVYGTHLFEQLKHGVIKDLHFVGRARLEGVLYDVGRYPALVIGNVRSTHVTGEVYGAIHANNYLYSMDQSHGYFPESLDDSVFLRNKAEASFNGGYSEKVWVYVYNGPVRGLKKISSGNYAEYLQESSTLWIFCFGNHVYPVDFELMFGLHPVQVTTGFIPGYRLTFHKIASSDKVVYGIEPYIGSVVYGTIYRIFHRQLEDIINPILMNSLHLHPRGVPVKTYGGYTVYAEMYQPSPRVHAPFQPNHRLNQLVEKCRLAGLPEGYVSQLESIVS